MDNFAGKVAIVTGGASGIGRALARELSDGGAHVVAADIDIEGAARVADEVGGSFAHLDVTDPDAVDALVQDVSAEHGSLDLLFNNAGISIGGEVRDMSLTHWDRIIDINLRGVVHGVQAAYPVMIEQGSGHIVNTASMAGLVPLPNASAYATTKHAVVGLSTSLRIEAAAYGVAVSVVCPGFVETALMRGSAPAGLERLASAPDPERDELPSIVGRPASPEAVAAGIVAGVHANKAIIVVPRRYDVAWRVIRTSPNTFLRIISSFFRPAYPTHKQM